MPEPRYPLAKVAVPGCARLLGGEAGIALAERRYGSFCEVASWPATRERLAGILLAALKLRLRPEPGRLVSTKGVLLGELAPGRFQVIAEQPGLAEALQRAVAVHDGAVVDLSEARGGVHVSGSRAQDLLQKGLDIDLHAAACPPMSILQSALHHMPITLLRLDSTVFDVFTFRGFALSLWEWVTDAAAEYNTR